MTANLLPLYTGGALRIQGIYDGSALDFSVLARLMHTELESIENANGEVCLMCPGSPVPADALRTFGSRNLQTVFDPERCQFHFYLRNGYPATDRLFGIYIWQISVICSCIAALLRGKPVLPVHCGMLEHDGKALLLCGESGMGKSTTCRRWRESGGVAIADDMVLLEFTESSGILVHRLPTWSACRESLDGRSYPYDPPLNLKHVFALSRSKEDQEYVKTIPGSEFYAQVYRCVFFHCVKIMTSLPEEYQRSGALRLREQTERLLAEFPAQGLFAHLDGDIRSTLKDYL